MKSGSVTYFETVRNGQRRLSGETESKEAIAFIRRYLYYMRVLGITFQLYFASDGKMISIQLMVEDMSIQFSWRYMFYYQITLHLQECLMRDR